MKEPLPLEGLLRTLLPASVWRERTVPSAGDMEGFMRMTQPCFGVPPCRFIHPNTCELAIWTKLSSALMRTGSLYAAIIIVLYLLKTKKEDRFKKPQLVALGKRIGQALLFVGGNAALYKMTLCYGPNFFHWSPLTSFIFSGLCSFSVLLDTPGIWPDLSLYLFPKAIESYVVFRAKSKTLPSLPLVPNLALGLAFGVASNMYFQTPSCIRKMSLKQLNIFIGPLDEGFIENPFAKLPEEGPTLQSTNDTEV